ncbi:hypothetical protein ACLK19_17060 [Escherichia coli]
MNNGSSSPELRDRMMETVFFALDDAEQLFAPHQPTPVTSVDLLGQPSRR